MSHFRLLEEDRKAVADMAETFYDKLTQNFGVTFVQDHGGEFGPAGKIYLTIRHKDKKLGDCHMSMEVIAIKKGMA